MEFAAVRAPGVLAHLRAANLLFDRFDAAIAQQLLRDPFAQAQHFRQRRSGRRGNLQHKMTLAEFRQKLAAEKRQRRQGAGEQRQRGADGGARVAAGFFQRAPVDLLQPAQVTRFLVRSGPREHQETKRGRYRERHGQRGQNGQDESDAQRREEPAVQAGHGEHGQEHQRHDE